jgi:hypothetical protein
MNIVQELRDRAARRNLSSIAYAADCSIDLAAADEIERLMRVVFFYAAECNGECCPDRHRDGVGCGYTARLAIIKEKRS